MKQPKISNLKVNKAETKKIRSSTSKKKNVKITINVDATTLAKLRSISKETGVPYQRLMNRLLKESLDRKDETETRLEKLEKELKALKEKIAA